MSQMFSQVLRHWNLKLCIHNTDTNQSKTYLKALIQIHILIKVLFK